MTPEQVLSYPARVLSQKQREFYFDNGYISVDSLIEGEWLDRLHAVTGEFLEKSRTVSSSNDIFDIAPNANRK